MAPLYKRILLKLSGESLMGEQKYGIDAVALGAFAQDVKEAHDLGVEMGIVFGGGNIYRGMQAESMGIDKVSGDHMGMLATVINCLAFQNALESLGVPTRLQTAIRMEQIAEAFIRRRAMRHLEKGRVVVYVLLVFKVVELLLHPARIIGKDIKNWLLNTSGNSTAGFLVIFRRAETMDGFGRGIGGVIATPHMQGNRFA